VAAARTRAEVNVSGTQALTDGLSRSLGIGAAVCVLSAVTGIILLRSGAGQARDDRAPRRGARDRGDPGRYA